MGFSLLNANWLQLTLILSENYEKGLIDIHLDLSQVDYATLGIALWPWKWSHVKKTLDIWRQYTSAFYYTSLNKELVITIFAGPSTEPAPYRRQTFWIVKQPLWWTIDLAVYPTLHPLIYSGPECTHHINTI